MNAFKFGNEIGLVFTKVLDEMPLGLVEEDEISGNQQNTTQNKYPGVPIDLKKTGKKFHANTVWA